MKKLEAIFVALTLLAFALSLNNIPLGNMLSIGLGLALIGYCIYRGFVSIKQTKALDEKILCLISYTIGTLVVVLASIYLFLFLPFGNYMIYLAAGVMGIITLAAIALYVGNKSAFSKELLIRNSIYMLWLILLASIPYAKLLDYKYNGSTYYQAYLEIKEQQVAYPDSIELIHAEKEVRTKMRRSRMK